MSAMAEVIDESIRNMTSNMVTKADQEKVCIHHAMCDTARSFTKLVVSTITHNKWTLHRSNRNCS
jgi:hypothetical protein